MDFRRIKHFVSVAELNSFTVSAEKNSISQQALSKHISDLEYELGCKLFVRTKTGITLTPEGQALLADANQILEDYSHFLNHAHILSKTYAGELRIGYGGYWEYPFLFEAVSQFSTESPYTNFIFTREHHGKLIHNFRQGKYDLVLTFEREAIKPFPNTAWFSVDTSLLYAAMADTHWLATRSSVSFKDLENENLICISRTNDYVFNEIITDALANAGVRPNYYEDAPDNAFDCLLLVAANKGISLYTKWMQRVNCPGVRFVPITPSSEPLIFGVAYRTDQQLPLIQKFIRTYKQVYWKACQKDSPPEV